MESDLSREENQAQEACDFWVEGREKLELTRQTQNARAPSGSISCSSHLSGRPGPPAAPPSPSLTPSSR